MAGRKVVIPDITDRPYRVFGSAPPLNVLLHVINPENMIGLSFAVPPAAAEFFPPRVSRLPVLGGVFGQGPQMNAEAVLALQPDFAIGWKSPFVDANRIEAGFARMGLPVVFIQLDTLADWPAALRFTGKLLRQEKRGEELARDVEQTLVRLEKLKTIPEARRPRVYYAEGPDGLTTDCHLSFHTEALELAGAYNVYRCTPKDHYGMEKVSLEQVLAYAPDIILTHDRGFASLVRQSPRWQGVNAVREGRIHLIPRWPHNWVDRPPSVMRALGALWLANLFYPTDFPLDVPTETRRFYRLFLGQELSDAQLEGLFR
jgi:iron complex transport system substrate-binding protein